MTKKKHGRHNGPKMTKGRPFWISQRGRYATVADSLWSWAGRETIGSDQLAYTEKRYSFPVQCRVMLNIAMYYSILM